MNNLKIFNKGILNMVSMASQVVAFTDKVKLVTYAMVCFLRLPQLSISIENFKLILHVYSILEVNSFGINATKTLVRAGTGIYDESNFINHSCTPNSAVIYRGRTQFIIATKEILAGEAVTISYIDSAIEEYRVRRNDL